MSRPSQRLNLQPNLPAVYAVLVLVFLLTVLAPPGRQRWRISLRPAGGGCERKRIWGKLGQRHLRDHTLTQSANHREENVSRLTEEVKSFRPNVRLAGNPPLPLLLSRLQYSFACCLTRPVQHAYILIDLSWLFA